MDVALTVNQRRQQFLKNRGKNASQRLLTKGLLQIISAREPQNGTVKVLPSPTASTSPFGCGEEQCSPKLQAAKAEVDIQQPTTRNLPRSVSKRSLSKSRLEMTGTQYLLQVQSIPLIFFQKTKHDQ